MTVSAWRGGRERRFQSFRQARCGTGRSSELADAVSTLNSIDPPAYPGTSLRGDLIALVEKAGNCDDRPDVVTATFEMARSQRDLHKTFSERFRAFLRAELVSISEQYAPLSEVEPDVLSDTVIALLAHYAGPTGQSVPRERVIHIVDHVLMVLMMASHAEDKLI